MNEIILPIFSGIVSGIVTLAVLKNDISWIKNALQSHDERLKTLERNK